MLTDNAGLVAAIVAKGAGARAGPGLGGLGLIDAEASCRSVFESLRGVPQLWGKSSVLGVGLAWLIRNKRVGECCCWLVGGWA